MKKYSLDAKDLLSDYEMFEIKAGHAIDDTSHPMDCVMCASSCVGCSSLCTACTTCKACISEAMDVIY